MTIDFDKRMTILEAACVDLFEKFEKVPTDDEIYEVSDEISSEQEDLENRIIICNDILNEVEQILQTARLNK